MTGRRVMALNNLLERLLQRNEVDIDPTAECWLMLREEKMRAKESRSKWGGGMDALS